MGNRVDLDICIGCGECQSVCPMNAVVVDEVAEIIRPEDCPEDCTICSDNCPVEAISSGIGR